MKKFSLIALSLVASTVVLSGCGEKKIEPNNYYCTTSVVAGGFGREELEALAKKVELIMLMNLFSNARLRS